MASRQSTFAVSFHIKERNAKENFSFRFDLNDHKHASG